MTKTTQVVEAPVAPAQNGAPLRRLMGRLEEAVALNRVAPATTDELSDRLMSFGLVLSIAGVLAQTALHLTEIVVFDRGIDAFDLDEDYGAASWASIVATFGAAFSSLLLGLLLRHRLFLALAAFFMFLSFDDFMRVHERVGEVGLRLGADPEWQLGRLIWPLVFLPLFAAAGVLLWLTARRLPARASVLIRAGLALLALAVVLEAASTILFHVGYDHRSWPYEIEVILEEGAELAGWIWIASALAAVACDELIRFGRRL